MKFIFLLLLLTSFNALAKGDYVKSSFAVDYLYEQPVTSGSSAESRPYVRGAEFMFYGAIDHRFDGTLTLASHQDGDVMNTGIHEAYVKTSKLIPNSTLKVGKFFVSLGKLNALHQHDWDFTVTPVVYEKFFGGEGALDSGMEYTYLLPTDLYQEMLFGITYGELGNHHHGDEEEEELVIKSPAGYLKYSTFFETSNGGLLLGLNFLGGNTSEFNRYKVYGINLTYKNKTGKMVNFQFDSEIWYKTFDNLHSHESTNLFMQLETKKLLSGYMNFLWGVGDSMQTGFLVDYFTKGDAHNPGETNSLDNYMLAVSPYLTYASSEFFKTRLTYSYKIAKVDGVKAIDDQRVMLQFVFILGDHPAHNF